ncbi:MAG TPA: carboxypeptidase regulatory-like domain-containing protein [Anaerolineales bacterium]|nr:carboxypeptidase regulatory-like domain-containing protein [Anaerolineales bacterium]
MNKRFIILAICCVLISGCAMGVEAVTPIAVSATATPVPAGDLGFGKIHGKVTDDVTGAPIAGAVITCEHHSFTSPATRSGTAMTDANGMYKFENVYFHDTDTIKLTVQATGYQTQEISSAFFRMAELEANVTLNRDP